LCRKPETHYTHISIFSISPELGNDNTRSSKMNRRVENQLLKNKLKSHKKRLKTDDLLIEPVYDGTNILGAK